MLIPFPLLDTKYRKKFYKNVNVIKNLPLLGSLAVWYAHLRFLVGNLFHQFRMYLVCFYLWLDFAFVWAQYLNEFLTHFDVIILEQIRLRDEVARVFYWRRLDILIILSWSILTVDNLLLLFALFVSVHGIKLHVLLRLYLLRDGLHLGCLLNKVGSILGWFFR